MLFDLISVISGESNIDATPPIAIPEVPYIWFDASDNSTFTLSGSDVDGWQSKGNYVFTISPLNVVKPQKVGNSVFFDNDPNAVGVSPAMLYGGDFPVADNGFYWTHFVVISEVVSGSMYQVPVARGVSSASSTSYHYTGLRTSDSVYYTLFRNNTVSNSALVTGPADFSPMRLLRSDFTDTGVGIDLNGSEYSNFLAANISGQAFLDRMFIGGERKSSVNFNANAFAGKVHEVLLYNRALTPHEISNVNAYLNSKWSIY